MIKSKLILDYDDTICMSSKCYCDTYSMLYKNNLKYKKPDYTKNDKWDFSIECNLEKNPENIGSSNLVVV